MVLFANGMKLSIHKLVLIEVLLIFLLGHHSMLMYFDLSVGLQIFVGERSGYSTLQARYSFLFKRYKDN